MPDFDALSDVGGGHLINVALEAEGCVVIDDPFMADQKDFIQLGSGKSADRNLWKGGIVAVDGALTNTGVDFMMIIVPEPEPE